MADPGDEMVTPAPDHGRLRASHSDRAQVVDVLNAAFVEGRLTQDELDARVGHALAALTYADLAALTTDLPASPSAPVLAQNRMARRAVNSGAGAIGAVILLVSGTALVLGQPAAAALLATFIMLLTAVATALVAALIAVALKVESRHQNRSRGQLPPGPASSTGGQAAVRPPAAKPARRRQRRPRGYLAVGRTG